MNTIKNRPMGRRNAARALSALAALVALASVGATSTLAQSSNDDDDSNWPMYNHDRLGTRYNASETTLSKSSVGGLHVKWQIPTTLPVSATPVVVGNVVYAGDMSGMFYAVSSAGKVLWSTQLQGSITASALVKGNRVVIGDIAGNLYGLNRNNGSVAWTSRPDAHPTAAFWGSPTPVGNDVVIGIASNEETAAGNPAYPCCSFRGSLLRFNPKDGSIVWKTSMISPQDTALGASGASIWSTPTYDPSSHLIYVTTGNNFNQPTTLTSDAVVAVDERSGAIAWSTQLYPNDEWNFRFPYSSAHPDADFGDSAQVYKLPSGRKVVGAGQKSGFYHVLDAATGALINQNQVEVGGTLGGLFSDSAVANGIVFANGVNWPAPGVGAPVGGDLIALTGDGQELWRFTTPTPDMGGVAVANSVVYFTSTFSQRLFALDASTGKALSVVAIGVSTSGPSISNGQIYVGSGDALSVGFGLGSSPGAIIALGL